MTRHPVLQTPEAQPWWRYGMVWLVLGGPAAVVVASLVTGYIAFQGADPIIVAPVAGQAGTAPAMQARNHAATPKR